MGLKGVPLALIEGEVMRIGEKFSTSVESFYDTDTLQRGWLEAVDRDGEAKNFPLMSVSAAIMELPVGLNRIYSPEEISRMMARMKKKAKASPSKICAFTLKHFDDKESLHTADPNDTVIILPSHRKNACLA
jgi:hypothetical protein